MSQKESLLQWLRREPITAIQALAHIRCMRLAAIIGYAAAVYGLALLFLRNWKTK